MTIQRRLRSSALLLARAADRRYLRGFSVCSLRLAAQDVALSRRKQGFEPPRERQTIQVLRCKLGPKRICQPKIDATSGGGVRAFSGVLRRLHGFDYQVGMAKKKSDADREQAGELASEQPIVELSFVEINKQGQLVVRTERLPNLPGMKIAEVRQ